MTNILAVETSTSFCSIAISRGGDVFDWTQEVGQKHSEHVLPVIDKLLKEAQLELKELDVIAYGSGPGSFTGVRIACGLAQGIGFAADKPLVAVSSLAALAHQSTGDRILVCLDARMGQVYTSSFKRNSDLLSPTSEIIVCDPRDISFPEQFHWTGCGDGFLVYEGMLRDRLRNVDWDLDTENLRPTAKSILKLGLREYLSGNTVAAENATPLYVRNKVALTIEEQIGES